jgi:hypothetical protein
MIPPTVFFEWTRVIASLSCNIYPSDRRRVRDLRHALSGNFDNREIRDICRRNIIYRKWLRLLVRAWPNWADRLQDWVSLEGDNHLKHVLENGRGAMLLSGHAFGFAAFVSPILTQKGFRVYRTGRGQRVDQVTRWGQNGSYAPWDYINYGEGAWSHLKALNEMRAALKQNRVIHASIKGFPCGDPRLRIDFCYQGFFLDPRLLRILEILETPVVPCFALCNDKGRLIVKMYSPIEPATEEIMRVFGPLYARYLRDSPEFSRVWRRVVQQKEGW